MRRSPWLGAATCCWLLVGACGEQPPARGPPAHPSHTPDSAQTEPSDAADDDSQLVPQSPENQDEHSELSPAQATRDAFATSEQLAERYGKARALAVQRGSGSYYSDAF